MSKYILRLSAAIAAFAVGIVFSSLLVNDLFSGQPTANEEYILIEEIVVAPPSLVIPKPDFIARGTDSFGNSASFSTRTATDGTKYSSTLVYGLKSEKAARKRMGQAMKNAVKIIEQKPYLDYWERIIGEKAIVQLKNKYVLVKYKKEFPDVSNEYQVSIIETETLQQAVDIDKERESFARSAVINKLN